MSITKQRIKNKEITMCLVLFAYQVSKTYPLILAANRDEFYNRPTAPMHFWDDHSNVLAGRDLEKGGTWFGVTASGCFAALTNFRDPFSVNPEALSRGEIIIDFLTAGHSCERFAEQLVRRANAYNGYNLLFSDSKTLYWFSSRKQAAEPVEPGVHGLSNRHLDTAWPKVIDGRKTLSRCLEQGISHDVLFSMLQNKAIPPDHLLPDTGVGVEWERILAPLFIKSEVYGTRSSTVMTIDSENRIRVTEKTFAPSDSQAIEERHFSLPQPGGIS